MAKTDTQADTAPVADNAPQSVDVATLAAAIAAALPPPVAPTPAAPAQDNTGLAAALSALASAVAGSTASRNAPAGAFERPSRLPAVATAIKAGAGVVDAMEQAGYGFKYRNNHANVVLRQLVKLDLLTPREARNALAGYVVPVPADEPDDELEG